MLRPVYSYNVASGPSSTAGSRVTPVGVSAVRLAVTADCYVVIGPNTPTATPANGILIHSGTEGETFGVYPGDQIAAIQAASAGSLNVTELSN